jgi:hypothetical protein
MRKVVSKFKDETTDATFGKVTDFIPFTNIDYFRLRSSPNTSYFMI